MAVSADARPPAPRGAGPASRGLTAPPAARTSRASQASPVSQGQGRLASPAIRALIRRRLVELGGLLLGIGGVALLVALASYDPGDPSLDTATSGHVANLVGPAGAVAADLLLQCFGCAAVLPGLAMLGWAWRMASGRGLGSFGLRLGATLLALPALGAALGALPIPGPHGGRLAWPTTAGPGGAAGRVLGEGALALAHAALGTAGTILVWVLGTALALGLTLVGFGLTLGEWRGAGRGVGRGVVGAATLSARQGRRASSLLPRLGALLPGGGMGEPQPAREPRGWTRLVPRPAGAAPVGFPPAAVAPTAPAPTATGRVAPQLHRPTEEPAADAEVAEAAAPRVRPRVAPVVLAGHEGMQGPALGVPEVPPPPPRPAAPPPVAVTRPAARPEPRGPEPAPAAEGGWRFPPLELLRPAPQRAGTGPSADALQANARLLETVLSDYGVQGAINAIHPGPVVTLYELEPAPGIRSARVIGLADDVARSLSVTAVRIATVPGRNVIGIEVPNARRETVFLSELLGSAEYADHPSRLSLALGKDISGAPIVADLARMPHLLVAGTTGSGKSVGINAMILSLLYKLSPEQCRLILIDPKMLELSVYDGIPHLMAPVVTEPAKAVTALKWTTREMERRYRAMSQLGVRNVGGYNDRVAEAQARGEVVTRRVQTGFDAETGRPVFEEQALALEKLPFIVVVIDEMADLMMTAGKEIEATVQRLAQMARAAGIHVIMATQRPSVDVITGTIKANFPTRISFQVISKFDSRTILGEQGAEQLLGQGDLLYMQGGGRIGRVHGPFVADAEVEAIVEFLREQGEPAYVEEVTEAREDDDGANPALSGIAAAGDGEKGLFDQAVAVVSTHGKASTSFIQRHLSIGYNRAAKLIEQMEKEGIVSPANHVGKREVLVRRVGDE